MPLNPSSSSLDPKTGCSHEVLSETGLCSNLEDLHVWESQGYIKALQTSQSWKILHLL